MTGRHRVIVWTFVMLLPVTACTEHEQPKTNVERTLAEISTKITELDKRVIALDQRVTAIDKVAELALMKGAYDGRANLTPKDDGFDIVKIEGFGPTLGVLTVSLKDVQPYAAGTRIALSFGNPTNATLTNVTAQVEWFDTREVEAIKEKLKKRGVSAVDIVKKADELEKLLTRRSREITVAKLRAGAWTSVSVILDAVPPSALAGLRVSQIRHTGIELLR